MKPSFLTETAGWIGVGLIFGAYALLTFGIVGASDWQYHAFNAGGGIGIILDAAAQKNWQPVVLNVAWLALAAFGIFSASL